MSDYSYPPHKSTFFKMDANIVAMVLYIIAIVFAWFSYIGLFAWLIPLIVLLFERSSSLVKYHAVQTLVCSVFISIVEVIRRILNFSLTSLFGDNSPLSWFGKISGNLLSFVFMIISSVVSFFILFQLIKGAFHAYKYRECRMPIISVISDKIRRVFKI